MIKQPSEDNGFKLDILANLPLVLLVLDGSGKIVRSNEFTRILTGNEVENHHFREVIVDFNESIDPAQLAAGNARDQLIHINTFTELPQTIYCNFFVAGDTVQIVGAIDPREQEIMRQKVTQLNQQMSIAARELIKANSELEKLNNLKSEFLGMAAHDLRRPVGVVHGFSELILMDMESGTENCDHRDYMERIHSSAKYMIKLIDGFLNIAIIESGKLKVSPESISLKTILSQVMDIMQLYSQGKGVPLKVSKSSQDIRLVVDGPKIEQILVNLISNAIEHSEPGSPVTIDWELKNNRFSIHVIDRGVGIATEKQKQLFDLYKTGLSKKTGGEVSHGLGLVISNRIATAHKGSLSVQSEEGKGSTFTLNLPVGSAKVPSEKSV